MTLNITDIKRMIDPEKAGSEMHALMRDLYPLCRSITGNGLRKTLEILKGHVPLTVHEVPSGTQVFDWIVPKEWNISDAFIKDQKGNKVVDFQISNLHVLNYSIPVQENIPLSELKTHLFTLPEHPDWIPYKTSYYKEQWGFCLSHNSLMALGEGLYEVRINSSLENGSLSYGELYIKGETEDEVLISSHCCHPSLANDNLSGVSLATHLARQLLLASHRLSYRFLFIPGTIGAITWLALNERTVKKIKHGLVLAGVGNPGGIIYKKSRRGDTEIDRAVSHVLKHAGDQHRVIDFYPYGYDERQYCSPGFDMPVGRLSRTPYRQYPEYHTSADNLDFVKPACLADTYENVLLILEVLESNGKYINVKPKCEPQLGKRGVYDANENEMMAMLCVLSLSDGDHTILDIAETSGLPYGAILKASNVLHDHGLLQRLA